jgi:hypothetical protein
MLFDPVLPIIALFVALSAVPLARWIQQRRGHLCRPLTASNVLRSTAAGVAGLVGALLLGLLLEHWVGIALTRTAHGVGLADPMSWLGAVTALIGAASWVAWQAALLTGPLIGQLYWQRQTRPTGRWITRWTVVLLSPLLAAVLVETLPMHRAPTILLAALILWAGVLAVLFAGRGRVPQPIATRAAPQPIIAMSVTRTPEERAESTIISLLPAALAQEMDICPPALPSALAEAVEQQALRTQETPYPLRGA